MYWCLVKKLMPAQAGISTLIALFATALLVTVLLVMALLVMALLEKAAILNSKLHPPNLPLST